MLSIFEWRFQFGRSKKLYWDLLIFLFSIETLWRGAPLRLDLCVFCTTPGTQSDVGLHVGPRELI